MEILSSLSQASQISLSEDTYKKLVGTLNTGMATCLMHGRKGTPSVMLRFRFLRKWMMAWTEDSSIEFCIKHSTLNSLLSTVFTIAGVLLLSNNLKVRALVKKRETWVLCQPQAEGGKTLCWSLPTGQPQYMKSGKHARGNMILRPTEEARTSPSHGSTTTIRL